MAYKEITSDKTINVSYNKLDSSHIGSLYGGLKNTTTNNITGNLASRTLTSSITNSDGWCTITL